MVKKVKSLLSLATEFPDARFSKEGTLILKQGVEIESEDLKYIGNRIEATKVDLPEEAYEA